MPINSLLDKYTTRKERAKYTRYELTRKALRRAEEANDAEFVDNSKNTIPEKYKGIAKASYITIIKPMLDKIDQKVQDLESIEDMEYSDAQVEGFGGFEGFARRSRCAKQINEDGDTIYAMAQMEDCEDEIKEYRLRKYYAKEAALHAHKNLYYIGLGFALIVFFVMLTLGVKSLTTLFIPSLLIFFIVTQNYLMVTMTLVGALVSYLSFA